VSGPNTYVSGVNECSGKRNERKVNVKQPTWPLKNGGVLSIESEVKTAFLVITMPGERPQDVAAAAFDPEYGEFMAKTDKGVMLDSDEFMAIGAALKHLNEHGIQIDG